jgi:hypothetical protein
MQTVLNYKLSYQLNGDLAFLLEKGLKGGEKVRRVAVEKCNS